MTGEAKTLYGFIAFFLIVVGVIALMSGRSTEMNGMNGSCWDKYTTEEAAILACEEH